MSTSTKRTKGVIAVTTGNHDGIGPEIIAKSLGSATTPALVLGTRKAYAPWKRFLKKPLHVWSEEEVFGERWPGVKPGRLNLLEPTGKNHADLIGRYIELAVEGCLLGRFSAICTGPIDKSTLREGGRNFDGHTEFLQNLTKAATVTMMLAGPELRVTLATTHVPIQKVSKALTSLKVETTILNTGLALQKLFKIKSPRIAVLGLNPHAGDEGLFGEEEKHVIQPAIFRAEAALKNCGIRATIYGPLPADGFFAQWKQARKNHDAVVCMYHDQGLIPVKMLDFKRTVNVTLGLPIVRTSVDHGVAYDIAGKGIADPSSFKSAFALAQKLQRN